MKIQTIIKLSNIRNNPFDVRMLLCIACVVFSYTLQAQSVSITPIGNPPDNSAALDIRDYTDKGVLIPRLTTAQRNAISSPAHSLLIFNTTTNCYEWWDANGSTWVSMSCGCTAPAAPTANAASGITQTAFTANWSAVTGATTYYLDVATDMGFTNFVSGYNNNNVGNVTSFNVTGLACNTTYYYRVRAGNSCGTSGNSNVISVTTSSCVPNAPACGSQVFMAVNIDVGTMINDPAVQNNDSQQEKYCYNNTPANCTTYGGLYQWAEAVQLPYVNNSTAVGTQPWMICDPCGSGGRQGLCPSGYHVPTDLEWSRYEYCVENNISPVGTTPLSTFQSNIGWRGTNSNTIGPGAKLKASSPAWDGTNASGFTALPAGIRYSGGGFYNLGSYALFWSATEGSATNARYRALNAGDWQSNRHNASKTDGFSLRCLQN